MLSVALRIYPEISGIFAQHRNRLDENKVKMVKRTTAMVAKQTNNNNNNNKSIFRFLSLSRFIRQFRIVVYYYTQCALHTVHANNVFRITFST